jgi:hypothetical protein
MVRAVLLCFSCGCRVSKDVREASLKALAKVTEEVRVHVFLLSRRVFLCAWPAWEVCGE